MFEDVSLEDFLNHDGSAVGGASPAQDLSIYDDMSREGMKELASKLGFIFYLISPAEGTIVFHSSGRTAGAFLGDSLFVADEFERRNLPTALVLYAYENGYEKKEKRKLTCGGRAVLTKAWEVGQGKKKIAWWPPISEGEEV